MLNFIEELLIAKKWDYSYCSDNTKSNSNSNIYLLSTNTSLNLLNSIIDTVIFMDCDFNPHRDI